MKSARVSTGGRARKETEGKPSSSASSEPDSAPALGAESSRKRRREQFSQDDSDDGFEFKTKRARLRLKETVRELETENKSLQTKLAAAEGRAEAAEQKLKIECPLCLRDGPDVDFCFFTTCGHLSCVSCSHNLLASGINFKEEETKSSGPRPEDWSVLIHPVLCPTCRADGPVISNRWDPVDIAAVISPLPPFVPKPADSKYVPGEVKRKIVDVENIQVPCPSGSAKCNKTIKFGKSVVEFQSNFRMHLFKECECKQRCPSCREPVAMCTMMDHLKAHRFDLLKHLCPLLADKPYNPDHRHALDMLNAIAFDAGIAVPIPEELCSSYYEVGDWGLPAVAWSNSPEFDVSNRNRPHPGSPQYRPRSPAHEPDEPDEPAVEPADVAAIIAGIL